MGLVEAELSLAYVGDAAKQDAVKVSVAWDFGWFVLFTHEGIFPSPSEFPSSSV